MPVEMSVANVLLVVAGTAALFVAAARLGLPPRRAAVLAGCALILCVASDELAYMTVSAGHVAPDASRAQQPPAAALRISSSLARGYVDSVAVSPPGAGTYDAARRLVSVTGNAGISIRGWAIDPGPHALGSGIVVVLDGGAPSPGSYGEQREDVGRVLGNAALSASGFTVSAALDGNRGRHTIAVGLVLRDGATVQLLPERITAEVR